MNLSIFAIENFPQNFINYFVGYVQLPDRFGNSGTPVMLVANYFRVNKQPSFVLTQYRVDFEPDLDVTTTRKMLIGQNRTKFGNRYIFDGASIYLTIRLDDFEFETTHNGKPMKITVRRTGLIDSSDPKAFQVLFKSLPRTLVKFPL